MGYMYDLCKKGRFGAMAWVLMVRLFRAATERAPKRENGAAVGRGAMIIASATGYSAAVIGHSDSRLWAPKSGPPQHQNRARPPAFSAMPVHATRSTNSNGGHSTSPPTTSTTALQARVRMNSITQLVNGVSLQKT